MASRTTRVPSGAIQSSPSSRSSPRPPSVTGRTESGTSGARRLSALKTGPQQKPPPVEPQSSKKTRADEMSSEDFREAIAARDTEIEGLKSKLRERESSVADSIQEAQVVKHDLEVARSEQHRLEDEIAMLQEELEALQSRVKDHEKSRVDSQILAQSEQQRLLEENKSMARSNNELSAQIRSLRKSLQSEKSREASQSSEERVPSEPGDDKPAGISLRETERQVESLKLELADMEVRLAEQASSAVSRSREIEDAFLQVKMENIRLSENIESYQMLLQDKTMKGEYFIANLEGVPEKDEANSSRSASPFSDNPKATSLAAELQAAESPSDNVNVKGLQLENRQLRESNKAMVLYISDIVGKLLETKGFEQVFEKDVNKSLPAPPSDRRSMQPPSRTSFEPLGRRNVTLENPAHKRMTSEAGAAGGISRAFSFRRKPDTAIANLRPLKLVEEQQPQATLRSDGTMSHVRSRTQAEETEESLDAKAAKRASWVPGWFAKAGTLRAEGD